MNLPTPPLHKPIMVQEILDILRVSAEGHYLDATLGDGGHSLSILKENPKQLISLDRDLMAIENFKRLHEPVPHHVIHHTKLSEFCAQLPPEPFRGILVDLGVSTKQLLMAERGFSFNQGGPLDMRMGQEGPTLEERLQSVSQEELARVLWEFADVEHPYGVARRILSAFQQGHLKNTLDLAQLFPRKPFHKVHPATKVFLALRMWVNDEMTEIQLAFPKLLEALETGGRMVVLTFHSTEDTLVKNLFKKAAGRCYCREPICRCEKKAIVKLLGKSQKPSPQELFENPRARSTRLRAVEKL